MDRLDQVIDRITEKVIQSLLEKEALSTPMERQPDPVTDPKAIARMIDHTILRPDATRENIVQLCHEAMQFGFAAVCVNPVWVKTAADVLTGSDVKVCTVVGFPLGASCSDVKAYETRRAILEGAGEIDMVLDIGALKGGDRRRVEFDIVSVARVTAEYGLVLKVILETCLLSREEKITACELCMSAGAQYVKTSTGFSTGGATVEDVRLMKDTVGDRLKVKASGGIRTYQDAVAMIRSGASRLGTSSGVKIVGGR